MERKPEQKKSNEYEASAIIYEGELTTRAGSLFPGAVTDYDVDTSKLFRNAD